VDKEGNTFQVAGQQDTAAFVTLGQQREHDLHLLPGLPDISQIVDDHAFIARVPFDQAAQLEIARKQDVLRYK
jgi:hypothetical protein